MGVVDCDPYYKYGVKHHLEGLPPLCIFHGNADELSPFSQTVELTEELARRGMQGDGNGQCSNPEVESRMIKIRYEELTWPEMREAIARQPVVLLPFGTVEDHGPHLPINTDNIIVEAICLEAARRAPGAMLVMPLVAYGLDEHHMDFPGTVSVGMETLLAYVADVAISAARHGFTHLLVVNGHGSNAPLADLVARRVVLETGAICGAMSPNAAIDPTLAEPTLSEMRRSEPGGVAHAGEYETAMMLHLRPDLVQMDRAVREMGQLKLEYFNWDHPEPSILSWQDWWSRMSESGVCGDPTVATAEFGEALFERTVENFIRFVRAFRTIPLRSRHDPPQSMPAG